MITKENFPTLMAAFCGMIQQQQHDRLAADGFNPANHKHDVRTETGRKFVHVVCGTSGKYMVEISTGNIFGIKGYGQVHKGHFYGTLETVNEYFWGEYYPKRLDGKLGIQKANGCPAITYAPKVEVALGCPGATCDDPGCKAHWTEDTVCPDGPACADPKCQEERVKQGLPVA